MLPAPVLYSSCMPSLGAKVAPKSTAASAAAADEDGSCFSLIHDSACLSRACDAGAGVASGDSPSGGSARLAEDIDMPWIESCSSFAPTSAAAAACNSS